VAAAGDFHRAENRKINVAAADHAKTVSGREIAGRRKLGDRLLAGIDEIGILLAFIGKRTHAEHAILALELNVHSGRNEISNQRWNSDSEIDIKAVAQFLGRALSHLIPGPGHCEFSSSGSTGACGALLDELGGIWHMNDAL